MIIGFTGQAESGKTTAANYLPFPRYSFATEIKELCEPLVQALFMLPSGRVPKENLRSIYQAVGDAGRPWKWIDSLQTRTIGVPVFSVDDVRYHNEVEWIRSRGGVIVRITRPYHKNSLSLSQREHASERELLGIEADVEIMNDGTLRAFKKEILKTLPAFVEEMRHER
jgi:hypothetical protein